MVLCLTRIRRCTSVKWRRMCRITWETESPWEKLRTVYSWTPVIWIPASAGRQGRASPPIFAVWRWREPVFYCGNRHILWLRWEPCWVILIRAISAAPSKKSCIWPQAHTEVGTFSKIHWISIWNTLLYYATCKLFFVNNLTLWKSCAIICDNYMYAEKCGLLYSKSENTWGNTRENICGENKLIGSSGIADSCGYYID